MNSQDLESQLPKSRRHKVRQPQNPSTEGGQALEQTGLFSPESSRLGEEAGGACLHEDRTLQVQDQDAEQWAVTQRFQGEVEVAAQQQALRKAEKLAYNALARREHSTQELEEKLLRKNTPVDIVKMVLRQVRELDLQSDERFTESFVRSRINRGQGPVRIEMELKQRGISAELADQHLAAEESFWLAQAKTQLNRRGVSESGARANAASEQDAQAAEWIDPESQTQQQQYEQHLGRQKQRASHARFLASRGFRSNTIAKALAELFD